MDFRRRMRIMICAGRMCCRLRRLVGLEVRDETVEDSRVIDGLEMDIVSHDVKKFFRLLLKKNGYVLEQLYSPLIVHTTPEHAELKEIAKGCITRHHSHLTGANASRARATPGWRRGRSGMGELMGRGR